MARDKRNPNPQVPANMTGGVDLTGTVDLENGVGDSLIGLNRQPEVIQTMTGGHGPLAGDVNMPDDTSANDKPDPDLIKGLHAVGTQWDGRPVRIVPPSRFRTMRYSLAPGQTAQIGGRDSRRTSFAVTVEDNGAGTSRLYIGSDLATVLTMGFALGTVAAMPSSIVMNHGDIVAIGADADNVETVTVSIAYEYQE